MATIISNRVFWYLYIVPNSSRPSAANMRSLAKESLVQTMAYRLFGTKPLSESSHISNWTLGIHLSEIWTEICKFQYNKMGLKLSFAKWRPKRRPYCFYSGFITPVHRSQTGRETVFHMLISGAEIGGWHYISRGKLRLLLLSQYLSRSYGYELM